MLDLSFLALSNKFELLLDLQLPSFLALSSNFEFLLDLQLPTSLLYQVSSSFCSSFNFLALSIKLEL